MASQGSAYHLAWSPDGNILYTSITAMVSDCGGQCTTQLGWVKAWDLVKGKLAFDIEVGEDIVARLAGMVYTKGMGTVDVWYVQTGEWLLTIPVERPLDIYALALSPDGSRLALGTHS